MRQDRKDKLRKIHALLEASKGDTWYLENLSTSPVQFSRMFDGRLVDFKTGEATVIDSRAQQITFIYKPTT